MKARIIPFAHGRVGWREVGEPPVKTAFVYIVSTQEIDGQTKGQWYEMEEYRRMKTAQKATNIEFYAGHPQLLREKIMNKSKRRDDSHLPHR